jgi:poly-gamma-glutamate capsule biosynthesis protein CapA/YwtB (metallophosphatase superfamily)
LRLYARRRRSTARDWVVLVAAAVVLVVAGALAVNAFRGKTAVGTSSRGAARPTPSPSPSPSPSPLAALSLASIFDAPPDLKAIDPRRVVTMVVTGDVIPARNVNEQLITRNDFLWPFRPTIDYLKSGDLLFTDLEAPLVAGCVRFNAGFKPFCGDPRFIDGLTYAGVTVANLSNNHLTNYGQPGTDSTIKLLTDHNIQPSGLGLVAHVTIKGVRFAFLGFNGVGARIDPVELKREITLARPTADVVVVQFHWGQEYVLTPRSTGDSIAPDDPKVIGHLAIDDGADLIIGNHPHAVQGVELYKGKLITYAHGNFVFDQMWTPDPGQEDPRNGVIGKYSFVDGKLAAVSYQPIRIFDYGQPQFLTGADGAAVMARMKLSTQMINGGVPN